MLKRSVLDFFLVVARRPASGAARDCTTLSTAELMKAHKEQAAPRADILSRLMELISATTDAGEQQQLQNLITVLKMESVTLGAAANTRVGESAGMLQLLWAYCGRISERNTATVALETEDTADSSSSKQSRASAKIMRPKTQFQFLEIVSIFQTTAHALGVANILQSSNFFRQVVFDSISRDAMPWQQAHELVLVYFHDVDNSEQLNMGNIYTYDGAQDTRRMRALVSAKQHYGANFLGNSRPTPRDTPDGKAGGPNIQGASDASAKICFSFNQQTDHVARHVKGGRCIFRHVCDHWVSNKGPKGRCEGNHSRKDCTNPDKSDTAVE